MDTLNNQVQTYCNVLKTISLRESKPQWMVRWQKWIKIHGICDNNHD